MKKHFYLHTSNLENAREFTEDSSFQPTYCYPYFETYVSFRNEYGRIKTDQNYYHIMLGTIRDDNCPWCGSVPNVVELSVGVDVPFNTQKIKFCMECFNCGSRGPVNTISFNDITDFQVKEHVKALIKQRYSERKQWDHDLKNPYEEPK